MHRDGVPTGHRIASCVWSEERMLCNTGRVTPHSSKPVPGLHLGVGAHLLLVHGGADFQWLALHRAVECTCGRGAMHGLRSQNNRCRARGQKVGDGEQPSCGPRHHQGCLPPPTYPAFCRAPLGSSEQLAANRASNHLFSERLTVLHQVDCVDASWQLSKDELAPSIQSCRVRTRGVACCACVLQSPAHSNRDANACRRWAL